MRSAPLLYPSLDSFLEISSPSFAQAAYTNH
uniref:Uncharacterized protein n=1 Tax=Arundo donax TaxID=35708 RepID=A0A0A9HHX4_ARUDO